MSPDRAAVIAVVATTAGWNLEDHASARPGTGQGRVLRKLLLPQLLMVADRTGATITASASTADLAAQYIREIPGLVDVGPARTRGRKLRRRPQDGMPQPEI